MTRFLIADDNDQSRYMLEVLLKSNGYAVVSAENGKEALEAALRDPPDMIVSDILMPVMDGFSLCRECKMSPELRNIPFVFYTSTYTDRKDEEFSLNLGAERFLIKPMEPDALMDVLQEIYESCQEGEVSKSTEPIEEEEVFVKEYNEALIRKLEDKMLKLEKANLELSNLHEQAQREIEERVRVEKALRKSESSLAEAQRIAHIGNWDWEIETDELYWSDEVYRIFSLTPQSFGATYEAFINTVRPADRDYVVRSVDEALYQGKPYTFDHGIVLQDGTERMVHEHAEVTFDDSGKPVRIVGTVQDITQRKQAEETIRKANVQLEKQLQRLHALRTIDLAITTSYDLNIRLNIFLDQVVTQLGADAAAVLLDDQVNHLHYAAERGFRNKDHQSIRFRIGECHAGQAALKRQLIQIPDLKDERSGSGKFDDMVSGEGFVTYAGISLVAQAELKGVLEVYHRSIYEPGSEWLSYLETLAGQAAIAIHDTEQFENLRTAKLELEVAYDATLEGWVRALDLRDKETEGHTQRVTEMTVRLATVMGMAKEKLIHIYRGALLHDIGKISISDRLLLKPGKLTVDERVIMEKHPIYAYELLSPISYLEEAMIIPYCHHERWDGSGYPRGLKLEEIPLSARIFSVVDVWDALSSDRPYREGWHETKVIAYIEEKSGTDFDPQVVETFIKNLTTGRQV
jgi:response regulator RpfG family c-di-GMP phosphodiesterase